MSLPPPDSWQRIESLFHEALAVAPESRETWLRDATGGDEAVIAEVLALLAADERPVGPGFISRIISAVEGASTPADSGWAGREVGHYRLIAEIGRGGMGTVYRAERADQAYRATVAIKFVRGGIAGPDLLGRLVAERQILADLVHPNIARLLDGGTTDDGTPYLVMEEIEGQPLDRYCVSRNLGLIPTLELFLEICSGVQHAHQALVIHRDLKPSNILITGDGTPKLVDFGIAKLLEGTMTGVDETLTGAGLMTPAYASPEQLMGRRTTVATDVYALGVILYQLLTDRHPLDLRPDTPLAEIVRRVTDTEPSRPSLVASGRAKAWQSALTGDLDAILLKALATDPERRYASVEQLAGDLTRYLRGEPVLARPASRAYRLGKLVRRHRTAAGATILIALALAIGLGTALWQRRQAVVARAAAVDALDLSKETRSFLMSLFRANDPSQSKGRELTARELLLRGVARVDSLDGRPALQAELLYVLGSMQMRLGDYRSSADLLQRSVARYRALPGRDTALVTALTALGNAESDLGWPDSAALAWQEAVDLGSARFGPESREILAPIGNLGIAYGRIGDNARAERTYLRTIDLERKVLGAGDRERVYAIANLALLYGNTGRYDEARPRFEEALGIARTGYGDEHTVTAFALDNYGNMLREAGRYNAAEPLLREGLAIRLKLLGPDHRFTAESYLSVGQLLAWRNRPGDQLEADSMLNRALRVYRKVLGPDHPAISYPMHALGVLTYNRGQLTEATRWFRQALAIRRAASQRRDRPMVMVQTLTALGHALRDAGSPEALPTFKEADSLARARVPAGHPYRLRAEIGYALALADQGDTTTARSMFRAGLASLSERLGPDNPYVVRACTRGAVAGLAEDACS